MYVAQDRVFGSAVADPAAGYRGAEKHEIYAAEFSGHLFYDLFLQVRGAHGPPRPPGSATAL